jgi:hypothetical protein
MSDEDTTRCRCVECGEDLTDHEVAQATMDFLEALQANGHTINEVVAIAAGVTGLALGFLSEEERGLFRGMAKTVMDDAEAYSRGQLAMRDAAAGFVHEAGTA